MRTDPAEAESPPRLRRLVVEEETGERIDAFVARHLGELSRSRVAQLLEAGKIRVNGAVPKKSLRPSAGDVVEVELPAPEPSPLAPEPIPLDVVYEDADLLVVDKPVGLVVHPAPGNRSGTLVNALLYHVGDLSGIGGVLRPGIVHRLDKDTSGLLVVAKNDEAHRALAGALKRREVKRIYLTATWGHLAEDRITIEAPIGRSPTHRTRMAVVQGGRPAVTHVRRLERWRAADLLRVELETGRTHQIRVHMASIGHPVVGDRSYGGGGPRGISGPSQPWARALAKRVHRQFLHAAELHFAHPRTGAPMRFVSELPEDLAEAAAWARRTSGIERGS